MTNTYQSEAKYHIAILGAEGFIGKSVVAWLRRSGHEVREISRRTHSDFCAVSPDWFKGQDIVVHAGGRIPARASAPLDFELSTRIARQIFAAVEEADVSQLILFSSASVYGTDLPGPLREDAKLAPNNFYGAACARIEQDAFRSLGSTSLTVVRPFNVYGRGGHGLVDRLLGAAKSGDPVTVYNKNAIRDYIGLDQISEAVGLLIGKAGTINLGTGIGRSTEEVVDLAYDMHPNLKDLITWSDGVNAEVDSSVASTHFANQIGLSFKDRLPDYLKGEC